MKIRNGFVSNSSSSSFVLDRRYLSEIQDGAISDYLLQQKDECWNITTDEDFIRGYTIMDNEYLYDFLTKDLKIDNKSIVSWGE